MGSCPSPRFWSLADQGIVSLGNFASGLLLARNLVERLITFSTGAPVQFADRADVEKIVERLRAKHYGLRAMVHEVVQSRMFQNK